MTEHTIVIPNPYTPQNADAYIRSAYRIPNRATYTFYYIKDMLCLEYWYNGARDSLFICRKMV